MKIALIRTIGILIAVLLLGDIAAAAALLFGSHHRKVEAEPENFRAGRIASAPLPAIPIARVSLTGQLPRPATAEPVSVVAVRHETPEAAQLLADFPERPRRVSPLLMKSMITRAGQN